MLLAIQDKAGTLFRLDWKVFPMLTKNESQVSMNNKDLVPLSSVLGGFILSSILPLFAIGTSYNYTVSGSLGQMVELLLKGFFIYMLGTYIGAAVPWFFSKNEKDCIPLLVALGAIVGLVFGHIITALIIFNQTMFLDAFIRVVYWPILFVFSFLGARIACAIDRPVPKSNIRRFILLSLGIIIFSSPLIFSIKRSDFPYDKSLQERHLWALRKFPQHYLIAIELVKNSPVIKQDVGENIVAGPAINSSNSVIYAPGESAAGFTLDVEGEKGKGKCEIRFIIPYSPKDSKAIGFDVNWIFKAESMPLTAEGVVDKKQLEWGASIKREKEFQSKLKRLFKEKKYAQVITEYQDELRALRGMTVTKELDLMLAVSHEALGNYKDASSYYYGVSLFEEKNNPRKARKYLLKALQLDPNNEYAKKRLGE